MNKDQFLQRKQEVLKAISKKSIVPKGSLKIHLDRLKKKHGWKGGKLEELSKAILEHNYEQISNKIAKISNDKLGKSIKRLAPGKKILMPELKDVLPARSVHIIKAAQNGKLIRDTLRDDLNREFRRVLTENNMLTTTGVRAGQVNQNVVKQVEVAFKKVYDGYLKKGAKGEMPPSIHNIAVTEVRTSIGLMKEAYITKIAEKNEKVKIHKRWIHNKSLAKNPKNIRKGHFLLNQKSIEKDKKFKVKVFDSRGKMIKTILMNRPHDPEASIDQKVGCNCDIVYFIKAIK